MKDYFPIDQLQSLFQDWERQDDELNLAIATLEDHDRDEAAEQRNRDRINGMRNDQLAKILGELVVAVVGPLQRCAHCGETKHTPARLDSLGGYVCLTCILEDRENLRATLDQNFQQYNVALAGKEAELARLRRGDFTPEEFQTLCHNRHEKPGCTKADFFDGCAAFQKNLFGCSERDALREATELVADLNKIISDFRVAAAFVTSMRPGSEGAFAKPLRDSDQLRARIANLSPRTS